MLCEDLQLIKNNMKNKLKVLSLISVCFSPMLAQNVNAQVPDSCPREIGFDFVGFGTGSDLENFSDDLLLAHGYGFINGILYSKVLGANDDCRNFHFDCLQEMQPAELVTSLRKALPLANFGPGDQAAGASMFEAFRLICSWD